MNILLVEPDYYTRYPPLGLMKLASYHRSRGQKVKLVRGKQDIYNFNPDKIIRSPTKNDTKNPVPSIITVLKTILIIGPY